MKQKIMQWGRRNGLKVGAAVAVVALLSVPTAVAGPVNSVSSAEVVNYSLNTIDMDPATNALYSRTKPKPGEVGYTELDAALKAKVDAAAQPGQAGKSYGCDGEVVDAEHPAAKCPGAPGLPGGQGVPGDEGKKGDKGDPATDVKGDAAFKATAAPTTVSKIGGPFSQGAIVIDSGTIPAGDWTLDVSGKFNRTVAAAEGAPLTRPMIQLQVDGKEVCSIGGNDIAPSLDADLFGLCSGGVKLTVATSYKLYAFGYDDKRGSAGSGELTAAALITGTRS